MENWYQVFYPQEISSYIIVAFTIYKAQGKNLDISVIDIGMSERCCGMNLFDLSLVRSLENLFNKTFMLEQLKNINQSNSLSTI